jgi:hypothetical protein
MVPAQSVAADPPQSRIAPPEVPTDTPMRTRELVRAASDLVVRCFVGARSLRVTREVDPETNEQWLELRLSVDATPQQAADAFDRFVAEWVAAVPWPDHHLVRLSYSLA